MFQERGYLGTTVRELAKEVGLTSGSIFHHFGTKEEILIEVVAAGVTRVEGVITERLEGAANPDDRARAMLQAHLSALLDRDPEVLSVFFYERWALSEDAARRLVQLRDEYEASWDRTLADLGGKFEDARHRRLVRLLLLGSMNWTAQWYHPGGDLTLDDLVDELASSFLDI
jgi:AcrR family transcriptional regulator